MSKSVLTCLLATTATVWLAVAIAQTIAPNNMLTAAGFVAKYPDTPEKQEIFNSLPPNRLVKRGRNGKVYYVYADPYPVYPPPAVVVVQPPPVIELAPIQREVIYPTGRYALHGDGVNYPYQWIWIPAAPPPPPPPR